MTERERPAERVPVAARHVCLLFRRFDSFFGGDVTRGYVRALEARGVPHLLVGGKSFHEREEVETCAPRSAAIEWPDDELSVFATLRGSLFAIGDEALLEYRQRARPTCTRSASPDASCRRDLAPIGEALGAARAHCTAAATAGRSPTRSPAARRRRAPTPASSLRPSGEQALANVLHVAELARSYERGGGISFRGFVEQLRDEAERRPDRRGADPRGGQRRRAPHDRAQGEGARVPGRHPGRHHRRS